METLQDRLLKLLEDKRLSQDDLASMINASQAAISKIVLGETKRSRLLPKIAEALEVTEQWLLFGDAGEPNAGTHKSEIHVWDEKTLMPDDMVAVPFFNGMSLSAGNGALNSDIPHSGASLWFAKSFIKRKGTLPEKVFCITVKGDSMEPRFDEGGVVMIDTMPQAIIDGKPYAITYQGQDYIKYIRRLPNNQYLITSENEIYEPFKADIEQVTIIGRVIAYQREEF